ncbi:MAG: HipA domain-containing protein, partial [Bacteroidales bacterium]|nr:HipA domain-containing protein [Bacteroidales bacterium]
VYRRMVFNHLMNNTDDHNKNFSFTMNRQGEWRLSPAYDMTYIIDYGGYLPNRDHCLCMRAKLSGVTMDDLLAFAKDNGIRKAKTIIKEVVDTAKKFRLYATKNIVSQEWIGRVETCILQHLNDWGYEQKISQKASCDGIEDIQLELAYKGNIHLLANVNGRERKYIIRTGTPLHSELMQKGLINVSSVELVQLAKQYFQEPPTLFPIDR